MTNANTNVIAKIAAVVAGLGLVAMSIAPAAQADTASDQAMIASLQAQLAALQAHMSMTTTSGSMMMTTFSTDLTVGSQGASVTALQNWLISKGFTISAGATGYFGAQTKAALASYQASVGITPAVGYFGPITRAKVNASGSTTTTTTTTTTGTSTGTTTSTTLTGGEGSIDNFKTVGASNTSLNENDSDQVLGFEFKADGSDLNVSRVDFDAYNSNNVGTIRPWGVFQTATLMDGSRTIGTVDATNQANWSQDGTATNGNQAYRLRFDGLNDVVKMGSTADFYLTLSSQTGIDNSNSGGVYTLTLPSQGLRATDAMGIDQYNGAEVDTTVSVFNTTNGSVVVGTGSDNPQTTTVQGDENVSTTNVTLLTFTLQAKDSDVSLYSLPVRVIGVSSTSTNSTVSSASTSNMVRSLKLYEGSTLLDTESIASTQTGATTTFQNLNLTLAKGTTNDFKVVAEINKIDGTNFAEGSGLVVSVPGGNTIDVENGSNKVNTTGSATGNIISFRSLGLSADGTPTSATAVSTLNSGGSATTQTGTFTFTFNVTAFGQDIFVGTTPSAFVATLYTTSTSTGSVSTTSPTASAISSTADRDQGTNVYVIHSGQTRQVTISVSKNGGNNGYYYARLNTLNFGLSNTDTTSRSIQLPTSYQTPQVIVQM